MATSNYITAAKQSNRQPTILVQIVDASGDEVKQTTTNDWDSATTKTRVETSTDSSEVSVGDARLLGTDRTPDYVSEAGGNYLKTGPLGTAASYYFKAKAEVFWFQSSGATTDMRLVLKDDDATPSFSIQSETVSVTANSGPSLGLYSGTVEASFLSPQSVGSSVSLYLRGYDVGTAAETGPTGSISITPYIKITAVSGSMITSSFDFGATPSTSPVFSADDTVESGASLGYTAEGSNADTWPGTSLGIVLDGDSLTAYRYYRITASYSTMSIGRSTIHELSITEGIFRYYGTHQDVPFSGVKPHIIGGSLSPLAQKIDLKKGLSTTGQVSVKLAWTKDVADLLATGYLKGKDVKIMAGFVGLSSVDYEPVITGTWYDYDIDETLGEITVRVQDIFKQFSARKLPTETYASTGVKTSTTIVYSNKNLVAAITDIYDKVGIRGRYIDTAAYTALETGALAGNDYRCTRTLDKPVKVTDLLDQLARTGGLFLVPTGDGKIKPKLYDATETPSVTLDINLLGVSGLKGNQKDLTTRSYHYFNPNISGPSNEDDYNRAYALIDANSEIFYDPEKGERQWFDKWKVGSNAGAALNTPPQALVDMASRWNGWFSEPRYSFDIKKMPPRYAVIEPGDVVGIDNLKLPITSNEYDSGTTYALGDYVIYSGRMYKSLQNTNLAKTPSSEPTWWEDEDITATLAPDEFGRGLTDNKPFIVLSRKFDPNKATIDLSLIELA